MFTHKIIDDLATTTLANEIENTLKENNHWYYSQHSTDPNAEQDKNDKNIKPTGQFVSTFYSKDYGMSQNQQLYSYSHMLLHFLHAKTGLKFGEPNRIKANFTYPNGSTPEQYTLPHVDYTERKFLSMVYYVNESDGDTVIFDKTCMQGANGMKVLARVPPKKGSAVIFPSYRFHASSNPINYSTRLIINFCVPVDNLERLQDI